MLNVHIMIVTVQTIVICVWYNDDTYLITIGIEGIKIWCARILHMCDIPYKVLQHNAHTTYPLYIGSLLGRALVSPT